MRYLILPSQAVQISHLFKFLLLLIYFYTLQQPAHAISNICSDTMDRNAISVNFTNVERQALDEIDSANVSISHRAMQSRWIFDRDRQHSKSIGFDFRYTIMDLHSVDAMTNGHLHTWKFPLQGQVKHDQSLLQYELAPALSVSSNVLKNPQLTNSNSFQLSSGLLYKKMLSPISEWFAGARSDHRFGEYRAYPLAGFCYRPGSDWLLQLALPDFIISKSLSRQFSMSLFAKPVGSRWHVFSKDKMRQSNFIYHARAFGISGHWQIGDSVNIRLELEQQRERQLNFVTNDNVRQETSVASGMGVTLQGQVLF